MRNTRCRYLCSVRFFITSVFVIIYVPRCSCPLEPKRPALSAGKLVYVAYKTAFARVAVRVINPMTFADFGHPPFAEELLTGPRNVISLGTMQSKLKALEKHWRGTWKFAALGFLNMLAGLARKLSIIRLADAGCSTRFGEEAVSNSRQPNTNKGRSLGELGTHNKIKEPFSKLVVELELQWRALHWEGTDSSACTYITVNSCHLIGLASDTYMYCIMFGA